MDIEFVQDRYRGCVKKLAEREETILPKMEFIERVLELDMQGHLIASGDAIRAMAHLLVDTQETLALAKDRLAKAEKDIRQSISRSLDEITAIKESSQMISFDDSDPKDLLGRATARMEEFKKLIGMLGQGIASFPLPKIVLRAGT